MEIVSILAYIAIGILVINVILAGFVVFFERRNPASSWAWLLVLLFIPVFGFVIYMIFGRNSVLSGNFPEGVRVLYSKNNKINIDTHRKLVYYPTMALVQQ